ncbi:MAG: hypothetical protein KVP17_004320 [Porospora cf. gigantea B]|uniref:uncharacterized protein n=1 Tax=Porospora cf. gigantea B TaxID=2853592 RepID=UPI003571DEE8|nr:MAG: hypothetical protein KVP17_004320 [Porospora cf. gigantea B]
MTVFLEALELAQVLLREDPVVIEAVKQVLAQDVCSMLGMKDFDPWKNKVGYSTIIDPVCALCIAEG